MGPLLYRIWRPLSLARRGPAGLPARCQEGGCRPGGPACPARPRRWPALVTGLLGPAFALATPIETAGHLGPVTTGVPGMVVLARPLSLTGADPAPWALEGIPSSPGQRDSQPPLTAGEPPAGLALVPGDAALPELLAPGAAEIAAAADGSRRGLRDALLSTAFGQEVLRLAVDLFTPTRDPEGRIHLSILGHGDFVLQRADGVQTPRPAGEEMLHFSSGYSSDAFSAALPGQDYLRGERLPAADGPLTLREFVALLAGEVLGFVTHPLTLLAAALAGTGYVVLRLALERHRRQSHRRGHRSSRHSHRRTRAAGRGRTARAHLPHTP